MGEKTCHETSKNRQEKQRSEVKSVSRWVGKLYLRRLAARLRRVKKRIPERDYKIGSPLITLLILTAMKDGRINLTRKVIYKTHERLQKILSKQRAVFMGISFSKDLARHSVFYVLWQS